MTDTALITRREGAVLILSNNNPAARNALTPGFYTGLTAALHAAAGDPPETGSSGADSSYHYSGAQGSFGEPNQGSASAGDFSYGNSSYQAEHGSGPIPEFHYNSVPPQKPPKKKKKLALVAVLISVGMVAVIALSMVAGGMLVQHLSVGTAASSSESQPEHLVINSSPQTDTAPRPQAVR